MQDFATRLRQRKVETSLDAAKGTAELLRQLVTSSRLSDPQSLLDEVKRVGLTLQAAQPTGTARFIETDKCLPRRRSQQPRTPTLTLHGSPHPQSWSSGTLRGVSCTSFARK